MWIFGWTNLNGYTIWMLGNKIVNRDTKGFPFTLLLANLSIGSKYKVSHLKIDIPTLGTVLVS